MGRYAKLKFRVAQADTAIAGLIAPLHLSMLQLCNKIYLYIRLPGFLLLLVATAVQWHLVDGCAPDSDTGSEFMLDTFFGFRMSHAQLLRVQ